MVGLAQTKKRRWETLKCEWPDSKRSEAITGREPLEVERVVKKDAQYVFRSGLIQERHRQAVGSFIPAIALIRLEDSAACGWGRRIGGQGAIPIQIRRTMSESW